MSKKTPNLLPIDSAFFSDGVQRVLKELAAYFGSILGPASGEPHILVLSLGAFFAAERFYVDQKVSQFEYFFLLCPWLGAELLHEVSLHYEGGIDRRRGAAALEVKEDGKLRRNVLVRNAERAALLLAEAKDDSGVVQMVKTFSEQLNEERPQKRMTWDEAAVFFFDRGHRDGANSLSVSASRERGRQRRIVKHWSKNIRAWRTINAKRPKM